MKEVIRDRVLNILNDKYRVNIEGIENIYDSKLLGKSIKLGAIELFSFFLEVEDQFKITILEEDVRKGKFKSINTITELICEKVQ